MSAELDAIRARVEAATPGPWEAAQGATADGSELVTTKAQKADFLALSLNDDEAPLWLVIGSEVIPAATGDGPRAEANAEFIAHAPTDISRLIAAMDAVKALASQWEARGESDMAYSKTIPDEDIAMEILTNGAQMVENARHIRNALTSALDSTA